MLTSLSSDTVAESVVDKTAFCTDAEDMKFLKLIHSPGIQSACLPCCINVLHC